MNHSIDNETINKCEPIENTLKALQPYMFSLKKITHATQHNHSKSITLKDNSNQSITDWEKILKNDQRTQENKQDIFFPKEHDQLFWHYYILVNGFTAYEMLDTRRFMVEKNEKLNCVELIRLNRKHLTANKIRGIDAIENTLVHDKTIDLKTFIALCVASNLNILFVHRRKVYEMLLDVDNIEPSNVHIIHQYDNPQTRYGCEVETTTSKLDEYLCRNPDNSAYPYYVKAVSITNPLRAISSYKVGELRDMIIKLKILDSDSVWKKTKPQIYEAIIQNL